MMGPQRLADVTVVVPAFNRAHVLGRALDSIERQSLHPAAVIVVDDGSTDDTRQVASRPGVTVLSNETNSGKAAARNRAISTVTTGWIAFLDSDDEWHENHLETLMASASNQVLLTAPAIDGDGRVRGNNSARALRIEPAMLFFPESIVVTSGTLVSTRATVDAGGFHDYDNTEDLDLWLRLLERGRGLALPQITSSYETGTRYTLKEASLRRNTTTTLESSGASWVTSALRRRLAVKEAWDDLRLALHLRRPAVALHFLPRLLTCPTALAEVLTYRWRARRVGRRWRERQSRPSST